LKNAGPEYGNLESDFILNHTFKYKRRCFQ